MTANVMQGALTRDSRALRSSLDLSGTPKRKILYRKINTDVYIAQNLLMETVQEILISSTFLDVRKQ